MRRLAWTVLAFAFATTPAHAQEVLPSKIALASDQPLAFILFNPSGEAGRVRSSEIIRIVSELVEAHTDFTVRVFDADEARGCSGRLGCIVRTVRRDYERDDYVLPNGTVRPFAEHVAKLDREKVAAPPYLIVMSNITGGDSDRMTITAVDTNVTLTLYHEALRDDPNWQRNVENEVLARAVLARPKRGTVREEFEARRLFEEYFNNDLRRRFDEAGHWEPFGQIEIDVPETGMAIDVDGVTVGATQAGLTTLTNVVAGEHTIKLTHPGYEPFTTKVVAKRRDIVRLKPQLSAVASGAAPALRQATLWGGLGVAAIGAAITVVAIAGQNDDVMTLCFDGEDCGGSDFTTFGFDGGATPALDGSVNPPGILVAPLGYSLALTGATWSLTTLLFGEDGDYPWLQIAAGLVVGGAAYGLSAALD